MDFSIVGDKDQVLLLYLSPRDTIFARRGSLIYSEPRIEILPTQLKDFMQINSKGYNSLAIGSTLGKIFPVKLGSIIANINNVLAFEKHINYNKVFEKQFDIDTKLTLYSFHSAYNQHLFLTFNGDYLILELEEGKEIVVDPDNLVAFEPTVQMSIVNYGNESLISGEEIELIHLSGEGKVWLQSYTK